MPCRSLVGLGGFGCCGEFAGVARCIRPWAGLALSSMMRSFRVARLIGGTEKTPGCEARGWRFSPGRSEVAWNDDAKRRTFLSAKHAFFCVVSFADGN